MSGAMELKLCCVGMADGIERSGWYGLVCMAFGGRAWLDGWMRMTLWDRSPEARRKKRQTA